MTDFSTASCEDCLIELGWTREDLAHRIGVGYGTARTWELGRVAMPARLLAWLRECAATVADAKLHLPPPPVTTAEVEIPWI